MDFTHPHFAEPQWLWFAALAPLALGVLQAYAGRTRQRQLALFAAPEALPGLLRNHSPGRRRAKNAMLILALVVLGLALARPQWGEQTEVATAWGDDIVFVLDCSRSMLAPDIRPTRLARARLAILEFAQRQGRGRVGLVAFAGQAFLQCPLTFDYEAFRESLLAVDDRAIPLLGTDLGRALEEGFLAMEKTDRRKIMVVLTDGEDLEGAGVKTAALLAEKGVVIFTLGVGTSAGSPLQFPNDQGQMQPVLDERGHRVVSRLDEATLKAIAEVTQGRYQALGSLGEGLALVRRALETSLNLASVSRARKLGVDRFHYPVAALLIFLVTESLTGTRRRKQPYLPH